MGGREEGVGGRTPVQVRWGGKSLDCPPDCPPETSFPLSIVKGLGQRVYGPRARGVFSLKSPIMSNLLLPPRLHRPWHASSW